MSRDWLADAIKKSRAYLDSLPEWKKKAIQYDADFRKAVKEQK